MSVRPKIIISSIDAKRLEKMLDSINADSFPGWEELSVELNRADIVEPKAMPANVVTMNSTVRFVVESSSKEFSLTLVYPQDAGGDGEKISILAPVGSALLGLTEGDRISWPRPGGGELDVRILEVTYQPERAGEYHR